MGKRLHLALRIATFFLVFSGYLALASVYRYGLGFLFFPAIFLPAMPLGEWLERRFRLFFIGRRIVAVLWLIFIPFSLQLYGLMDAVIFLVIFIQFYLMTGEKSSRVYYEIFLMAFFLLLAAVVQSPEPLIAIAFFFFAISSVWAFSLVKMYHDQMGAPPSPLVELYRKGRKKSRPEPGGRLDAGFLVSMILLSCLAVGITVVSFLFTPRVEAGWLGRQDPRYAFTGTSETVRITGGTNVYESPSVVMHVRLPEEQDRENAQLGGMYWRITTLNRFFEDEWTRRGLQANYEPGVEKSLSRQRIFAHAAGGRDVARKHVPGRKRVEQYIFMGEVPDQGVPAFDKPLSLSMEENSGRGLIAWEGGDDFTISLQTAGPRRLQYKAVSEVTPIEPERLRQEKPHYDYMDSRDYKMLTSQDLLPETLEKVREVIADAPTLYDQIRALERWLSSSEFQYTLNLPLLPDEHGIDAFLMDIKEGHCEFYATALALMIRSLDVPARVVSGYRGAEYSATDDAYIIRASMSHLWVEALFPEVGWIRFDPSPQPADDMAAFDRFRMAWSLYLLRAKMFWFQDVVGFQGGLQLQNLRWPWKKRTPVHDIVETPREKLEQVPEEPEKDYSEITPWIFIVVPFLFLALFLVLLRRRWKYKEPFPLSSDQQQAQQAWCHFLRKGRGKGVHVENRSPAQVLSQLRGKPSVDYEAAAAFARQYEAARFGKQPCSKSFRQQVAAIFRRKAQEG